MNRLIIATVSLSIGMTGMHGGALAQVKDAPIITGNVDGNCITSPSVNTTGANAGDWTITCGDISPGPGLTVIGPPSLASEPAPVVAPEPVVAPANEPAPVVAEPAPVVAEPAPETAVADTADLEFRASVPRPRYPHLKRALAGPVLAPRSRRGDTVRTRGDGRRRGKIAGQ